MGAHLCIPSLQYKTTKPRSPAQLVLRNGIRVELPVTPSLEELEKILGYTFKNKKILQEAYIHSSVYYEYQDKSDKSEKVSGPSYERLEFIGDSILGVLVAKEMFVRYPELAPGPLTKLRAANVGNEKLARVAMKHGFHRFLCHKNHQLIDQIQDFSKAILKYPLHSNGLIDPPKFLADIVESTIGAIYVDSNFSSDTVWKVFKKLLEPIITQETIREHPCAELQEWCQERGLQVRYMKGSSKLLKNNITIEAIVDGVVLGSTTYVNGTIKKEIAQNRAAKEALAKLKHGSHPFNSKKIAQNRAVAKEALDEHELEQTLLLAIDDDDTIKDST